MTRWLLLIPIAIVLVACNPTAASEQAIADAVAGTMEAAVVQTGVAATQAVVATPNLPCLARSPEFFRSVDDILDRWLDAAEIADSTSRISLAQPVGDLQDIRRELKNLDAPDDCAGVVWVRLGEHMDATIEGFLAFMRQDSDSIVSNHMREASESIELYMDAMATITAESAEATREAAQTATPSPTP